VDYFHACKKSTEFSHEQFKLIKDYDRRIKDDKKIQNALKMKEALVECKEYIDEFRNLAFLKQNYRSSSEHP
jgi:hypothetical protein